MSRSTLTDSAVRHAKPGDGDNGIKMSDGGGLYLHVTKAGKYWRLAYRFNDKQKLLALGIYPAVPLAMARERRDQAKSLLAKGIDPSAARREAKRAKAAHEANTFAAVAKKWLAKTAALRNDITQQKVTAWLDRDVLPFIGHLPVADIGPRDMLDLVLHRIEARGAIDTAHRIKQLCGQIFRFAVVSEWAERDVTADLREALTSKKTRHLSAIVEAKHAGELLRAIYDYRGHPTTMAALKLAPLVFVRPGELRHAAWSEIDWKNAEWRIPGAKMKMGVDHIVPLSTQAVQILAWLKPITGHGNYVFPSLRTGEKPMSENTINAALRGMGFAKEVHTGHGFRAMARTLLDEVLGERVDLIEHQLAHAVKDANGRAYNRTTHLPARREMMQKWADYLDSLRSDVTAAALEKVALS